MTRNDKMQHSGSLTNEFHFKVTLGYKSDRSKFGVLVITDMIYLFIDAIYGSNFLLIC